MTSAARFNLTRIGARHGLSRGRGWFLFSGAACYGRRSIGEPAEDFSRLLADVIDEVSTESGDVQLPFDLAEVVTNLREERYPLPPGGRFEALGVNSAARSIYYFLRPLLAVGIRKHLQRTAIARLGKHCVSRVAGGRQRRSDHARHDGVAPETSRCDRDPVHLVLAGRGNGAAQ